MKILLDKQIMNDRMDAETWEDLRYEWGREPKLE
jgi:hypothetical protein